MSNLRQKIFAVCMIGWIGFVSVSYYVVSSYKTYELTYTTMAQCEKHSNELKEKFRVDIARCSSLTAEAFHYAGRYRWEKEDLGLCLKTFGRGSCSIDGHGLFIKPSGVLVKHHYTQDRTVSAPLYKVVNPADERFGRYVAPYSGVFDISLDSYGKRNKEDCTKCIQHQSMSIFEAKGLRSFRAEHPNDIEGTLRGPVFSS